MEKSQKTAKTRKRRRTADERADAVALVETRGLTVSEVARRLGVTRQTVHNWLAEARALRELRELRAAR